LLKKVRPPRLSLPENNLKSNHVFFVASYYLINTLKEGKVSRTFDPSE